MNIEEINAVLAFGSTVIVLFGIAYVLVQILWDDDNA